MRRPLLLPLVISATLVGGCSLRLSVAEEWFTVGHSSGGPGPVFSSCTFYRGGLVELNDGSAIRRWARLSQDDLRTVEATLTSSDWNAGLEQVSAKGPRWSCCDRETIEIWFRGGASYSIPDHDITVIEKKASPPDIIETPSVPPPMSPGLRALDQILSKLFGAHWEGFGTALPRSAGRLTRRAVDSHSFAVLATDAHG